MGSTSEEDSYFEVALQLVKDAGRMVRDAYDRPFSEVRTKLSNTDLVTETDQNVETLLTRGLSDAFPNHQFIGEESASAGKKIDFTDAPTWIIDPIDGTTNFVHRIPMICICVGLTINKQLRIGIVYNPITYELYTARAGQGAYKNGFRIHVSETEVLSKSVIASTIGIHNIVSQGPSWLDKSLSNSRRQVEAGVRGIRSFGSAAINMVCVAQGSLDAYVEYGLHCWDVAAAGIILKEAGGILIDPTGGEFNMMSRKVLCAATLPLATQLSGLLTHANYEPEG